MKILNKYLSKYGVIIFAIVTLILTFSRVPFWDETHAFDISCLKLSEIFQMTRIEGHTILWYLIVKPFTHLNWYPYQIYIINWLFCVGAIFVLWKKAPFSPLLKFLISFSFPFLLFFGSVARCYAIGILFLFLICAYYPTRYKKPYLFASLVLICANTSVMCALGCFWIGVLFLYELIVRYKKKICSAKILTDVFLIFLFCGILLLLQLLFPTKRQIGFENIFLLQVVNFVIAPYGNNIFSITLHTIASILFYFLPFYLFKNSKKALFLGYSIIVTLTLVFYFVYIGSYWNYYFYFVYFIIFCWLFYKKLFKNKFVKTLIVAVFVMMLFPNSAHERFHMLYIFSSQSNKISEYITKHDVFKNAKLYTLEWWSDISPGSNVFLARKGYKMYDYYGYEKRGFESLKRTFTYEKMPIDFDDFVSRLDKNERNIILSKGELINKLKVDTLIYDKGANRIIETKKGKYVLKIIAYNPELRFIAYEILW